MVLRVAEQFAESDTGRERVGNEDALIARAPIFAVADGMGGARAGEVASRLAVAAFEAGLPAGEGCEQELAARAREANVRIHELARDDARHAGMGTTLSVALVDERDVVIAHVGDSRVYVLRAGGLARLTEDHSLVGELVRRGQLTEREAAEHPQRSVITRALGPEPVIEVDTLTYPARPGDVFLLCSDGLTSMVGEDALARVLRETATLSEAGRRLIEEANAAGGRDNITVVLFRLEEVATPAAPAPPAPPMGAGPHPRRRRSLLGPSIAAATLAALVAAGGWIASRAVYFVGSNDEGLVTVYRGLPYELGSSILLYESRYISGVPAAGLPPGRRQRLLDHRLRSRDDAAELVRELERGRLEP